MSAEHEQRRWSPEQRQLLEHERFQAEVGRIRGSGSGGGGTGKPSWQRFLESTGGAALITVLVGGLLGNWIAGELQEDRAENERRYLTHQEYLEERLASIRPTFERIGQTVAAAEDMIAITRPEFDPAAFDEGEQREATLAKRVEIREAYNDADSRWRAQKETLGYLLAYYHPGVPGVSSAWDELASAVTFYLDCARSWYVEHRGGPTEDAAMACGQERTAVDQAMRDLIETIDTVAPTIAGAPAS